MSGLQASLVLAGVTWRRLMRGRTVWVALGIAALPILFVVFAKAKQASGITVDVFTFVVVVLCVLAAMFVGGSIGEEVEDRTITYLWSRPLPRWSVLAGKLLVIVPLVAAIGCASWLVAGYLAAGRMPPALSFAALALGAAAISMIAAGITMLSPKHGMALSICYLLFLDTPAGIMPVSLRHASVTNQIRIASGMVDSAASSALIGIVLIGAIWTFVAMWRVRKLEA